MNRILFKAPFKPFRPFTAWLLAREYFTLPLIFILLPACVRVSDGPVGPVIANILPQPRYRVSNLFILPGHADYLLRKSYGPLVDVFNILEKHCFGLR